MITNELHWRRTPGLQAVSPLLALLALSSAASLEAQTNRPRSLVSMPDLAAVSVRDATPGFQGCFSDGQNDMRTFEATVRTTTATPVRASFRVRLHWRHQLSTDYQRDRTYDKTIDFMPGGSSTRIEFTCVGHNAKGANFYWITVNPERAFPETTWRNNETKPTAIP